MTKLLSNNLIIFPSHIGSLKNNILRHPMWDGKIMRLFDNSFVIVHSHEIEEKGDEFINKIEFEYYDDFPIDRFKELDYKVKVKKESLSNISKQQPKTRRILEIQSDLFQKGRDSKRLITVPQYNQLMEVKHNYEGFDGFSVVDMKDGEVISVYNTREEAQNDLDKRSKLKPVPELTNEEIKANQFLQLLNKDNNWVTFFVKSIIQDSAKKGYEKVLFPTGNTASKAELS